jgi:putative hydrolase of the HAD superfamily
MIKAIIFDIYGTLLKKNIAGDLADTTKRKDIMIQSFNKLKERYKLNATPEQLFNIFIEAINTVHKRKIAKGVAYPEVKIENIWLMLLNSIGYKLKQNEMKKFCFKIAKEHENLIPRYLYPNTVEILTYLKKSNIYLGIISNAQFYTILDMKTLLKKNKCKYSFDEIFNKKLCFYSYKEGYSKPNLGSFNKLKKELSKLKIKPQETLYVGNDMLNDIYASNKAGLKSCLTINKETKYRKRQLKSKIKPNYKINNLNQIIKIVENETYLTIRDIKSRYKDKIIKNQILPLITKIKSYYSSKTTTIIGIQGGQGTGKTTLQYFLKKSLNKLGYSVESFSMDDFYESHIYRLNLRKTYPNNPYYQLVRGAPGTHRIKELKETLKNIKSGKPFKILRFDKSLHNGSGDTLNKSNKINKRPDFVFIDGFFLGLPNISKKQLQEIYKLQKNSLKTFNIKLTDIKIIKTNLNKYKELWKFIDKLIMIKEDSPKYQVKWRLQQEKELKKKKKESQTKNDIIKFTNILMPFSVTCYNTLKPNIKINTNNKHEFYNIELNEK